MKSTYRLYVGWFLKVMLFGLLGFFTIIGVGLLFPGGWVSGPPPLFGVFWLGMIGFMWYQVLTTPHQIELDERGLVTFVSILKRVEVNSGNIESIRPQMGQLGFLVVRHQGGRLRLLSQFDDFHVFLTELRALNPRVQLRGC